MIPCLVRRPGDWMPLGHVRALCHAVCMRHVHVQVIGVKLTGKMSKWTSPKDVILKVGGRARLRI